MDDWRDKADSVKYRLKYILANENTQQDVLIIVRSGSLEVETVVKAHSLILIMGSPVFEELLEKAKVSNEGFKEIKIPNVSPEALKFVLKHIYTDYVNMDDENVFDILNASLKLNLRNLVTLCIAKLQKEISARNVLSKFEEAVKMNVQELVQASQDFILKNALDVFEEEEFLNINKESLCKLLASDDLALDEVSLFKWLLRWGEAECERLKRGKNTRNLRLVLKKVLPLIRFPLMTSQQFATVVVQTKILDDSEVIDVYNYLSVTNSEPNMEIEPPQWIFSISPRNVTIGEQAIGSTDNQNEHDSDANEDHDESEYTKKEKLLRYLQETKQNKTICGLFCTNQADTGIQSMENITGVQPGILTLTMPSYCNQVANWQSFTDEIISHWNNGFLIRILWWGTYDHPLLKINANTPKRNYMGLRSANGEKWEHLLGDNAKRWKEKLDAIAPYFKKLQDAGVVAICDLLPYINYSICFWSGIRGGNGSLKLYQITHDYLTKHHDLNSILWNWSLDVRGDMTNLDDFWPGDNYVDVASVYIETEGYMGIRMYKKLLKFVRNKPMSIEYTQIRRTPQILAEQPGWTWFSVRDDCLVYASCSNDHSLKTTFDSLSVISKGNNEFFKTSLSTLNDQNSSTVST